MCILGNHVSTGLRESYQAVTPNFIYRENVHINMPAVIQQCSEKLILSTHVSLAQIEI